MLVVVMMMMEVVLLLLTLRGGKNNQSNLFSEPVTLAGARDFHECAVATTTTAHEFGHENVGTFYEETWIEKGPLNYLGKTVLLTAEGSNNPRLSFRLRASAFKDVKFVFSISMKLGYVVRALATKI